MSSNKNKKVSIVKHKTIPFQVTSASIGFSEGMKRDLASLNTENKSVKRQCVMDMPPKAIISSVPILEISKANQARSVVSISGQTTESNTAAPLSMIQCSVNWIQMQKNEISEEKQNKKRIEALVKHHLFKDLKFIPSQEMMVFSSQKQSLNYLVCQHLNIKTEEHQSFWSKYSKYVEKGMNAARNDSVQSLKCSFLKGKRYCISLEKYKQWFAV